MKVWIDLANSPHVQILEPIIRRLRDEGNDVWLTARPHAQTVELASRRWRDVMVVGDSSPSGIVAKGLAIVKRAEALRRLSAREHPDVALSHGSYAQIVAARTAGVPPVTMMDYDHQPANHLSFRLARRVVVPQFFPERALRRFGAPRRKVIRFPGFKEELYLDGFKPNDAVLEDLELDQRLVLAVFRPPPLGALYHRAGNARFDELLQLAAGREEVRVVLLPRTSEQGDRYQALSARIRIPRRAIDACSLLALADLTVGAGGTMTRESAILGTPTYTVFAGRLAAVDAELIRSGRLVDLRAPASRVRFEKKATARESDADANPILGAIKNALQAVTEASTR
jgi:predicted glycosyltransferase